MRRAVDAARDLAYSLDAPPAVDDAEGRRLLGGKGKGLAEMFAAGLPVPPAFILTTDACRRHLEQGWDEVLDAAVRDGIDALERAAGRRLGDAVHPLLVSVRSGAEVSMPGMMDTVLDVGMNALVENALAAATGDPAFAADTRCRALRSYAEIVADAPADLLDAVTSETSPDALQQRLAGGGVVVPEDPVEQLVAAVRAVFASWSSPRAQRYREVEGIDDRLGTAAIVQVMVFGNLGEQSATGVAFSRDPATGERGLMGDYLPRAQGEDVVRGARDTLPLSEMATAMPEQHAELERIADRLERATTDMVDLEFTVESGRLWLLQTRRAKRSSQAAFRVAVEMAEDESFPVDRAEAVARCVRYLDDGSTTVAASEAAVTDTGSPVVIASGMPASPGSATGVLCLDLDDAVEREAAGESVILVRGETSPADIHGMAVAAGLFTLLGGLVSHAAVVARDWGLPAVVGASDAEITDDGLVGPGGRVATGTVVTVDGTAGTLTVGEAAIAATSEAPEVATIREWARSLRPS
ncbi:MAG: pyruvate, phosphate dikinase [Acidimicrobiales bacterium]|nr:pyruvate, phosphate dikinase [Acidimicrobiales bacterium]